MLLKKKSLKMKNRLRLSKKNSTYPQGISKSKVFKYFLGMI